MPGKRVLNGRAMFVRIVLPSPLGQEAWRGAADDTRSSSPAGLPGFRRLYVHRTRHSRGSSKMLLPREAAQRRPLICYRNSREAWRRQQSGEPRGSSRAPDLLTEGCEGPSPAVTGMDAGDFIRPIYPPLPSVGARRITDAAL